MSKEEIIAKLKAGHAEFISTVVLLNESQFAFSQHGKWNAGQTLDHLYRAVGTLSNAMKLPLFMFSVLFGKSNRPSRSYDDLVAKYRQKLEAGGRAGGRYLPSEVTFANRAKTVRALERTVKALCDCLNRYSDAQLDSYILPHPLLGKITIREMMYFTIYHAEHHRRIVLRDASP